MTDQKSPQQHLDDRADPPVFHLVDEGPGMSEAEASRFLRGLRPVLAAGRTLRDLARSVRGKA